METVEPGAGSELAQPQPIGSPKPLDILILTPLYAQVGTGCSGQLDSASVCPSVAGRLVQVCAPVWLGLPPPRSPHTSSDADAPCPVPAWRKLGRDNASKLVRRGLWSWPMPTGRPRAFHFSLSGLHSPAWARETPRKCLGHTGGLSCQLPGLGAWGGRAGPISRSGGRGGSLGHRGWTLKDLSSTLVGASRDPSTTEAAGIPPTALRASC